MAVDRRIEEAVGNNLLKFLLDMAQKGKVGSLSLDKLEELCNLAVGLNLGWIKDEFRDLGRITGPTGHQHDSHEWIPSNLVVKIVRYVHEQSSAQTFARASRWIHVQNQMRVDTQWIIFRPTFNKTVPIPDKNGVEEDYSAMCGHVGAVKVSRTADGYSTTWQDAFHRELRTAVDLAPNASIPGTIDEIVKVLDKYVWDKENPTKAGAMPHLIVPTLTDAQGRNIPDNINAVMADQQQRRADMRTALLTIKDQNK